MARFRSAAAVRYQWRFWPLMAVYVFLVFMISWITPIEHLPNGLRHVLALTPVAPLAGVVWAMARQLEETEDEYFRMLQARAMLLATGIVLIGGTAWGFLQQYGSLPPFPVIIIFPIWCVAFGLSTAWTCWKHR